MNPLGPAGVCVESALDGQVTLLTAEFILREIRDLPNKPTPARAGVTAQKAEELVQLLMTKSEFLSVVPTVFVHPIDEDDSGYVNLAVAAGAKVIVSRDRHLLNLNNAAKPWSSDFRSRFPDLRVITAEQMLAEIRHSRRK